MIIYSFKVTFLSLIFLMASHQVQAQSLDLSLEEGNHTWAKSESWTWMGHLNEYTTSGQGTLSLSENGLALIHYYTRNQTQFGSLTFKSSALTYTKKGIGEFYDKRTIYSEPPISKNKFQLKIQESHLNIEFKHNEQIDQIRKTSISESDIHLLKNKLLPLYPGLKMSENFDPVKYTFSAFVGSETFLSLELYQIWPSISPKDAKMQFLGIPEAYTFSQPMLVAVGSSRKKGISTPVVGLLFLDRQWCKDYFGKNIMGNPIESLQQNQALKYSHSWSAFHAHSEQSQNWYFVHLWRQYQRNPDVPDKIDDYSGIVWVKNGIQQTPIEDKSFNWIGSKFIKNKSHVMLNYAVDRETYFPSQYHLYNKANADSLSLQASPRLQSLDQPIYLYEGYASGGGTWDGESVKLQGRVESSRTLFRLQDYIEMLGQIKQSRAISSVEDPEQEKLGQHLEDIIAREKNCKNNWLCFSDFLEKRKAQIGYMLNDLKQKMEIFQSGFKSTQPVRDAADHSIVIYN
ncbi:MAG TPA: hypothetical protein VIG33_02305 [Pseudobdellovibrionaceae bacterium]|jgi:hypothetical protein